MATNSSDESNDSISLEGITKGVASMLPASSETDDNNDCGMNRLLCHGRVQEPSELYGKYTWTINKFSQISRRELCSDAFEVGGYKWYILMYPKGCDVSDHLSVFLCVADHCMLPRGWVHFAQFTVSVMNKNPKKSKYSDTLHRFWEREHDWGWKKFMEVSKLSDGFVDNDTIVIKVQVQVIRERSDGPFRCLDKLYRRELEMVYMSNVEGICSGFVQEKIGRIGKLIEDKVKWPSFCRFWSSIGQDSRDQMSWEKADSILPHFVKLFFVEKEATSTLLMESLCVGLTALKEPSRPVVRMEEGSFVLVDDLVLLLERVVMEPLAPMVVNHIPGDLGDVSQAVESNEKRLTEYGRAIVEIFVLDYIFSKTEVAYNEAVQMLEAAKM